jgi:phosphoglycerate dehydrogenase-like enzyme
MHVLVLDSLFDSVDTEREQAAAVGWTLSRWGGSERELGEADVVAHVRTRVDATLIGSLSRCRVIARFGTGLDSVDLQAAQASGIAVVGVRDYCTPELCSQTLALGFALLRRLKDVLSGRTGDLSWQAFADRFPISGGTNATVVGFGSIGQAVSRALAATGFEVSVVTREGADAAREAGLEVVPLEEGLARADFVTLHPALTPLTARMIDQERLKMIRPGAVLVNTARLGLFDEEAVVAAVRSGRLGGLGVDAHLSEASPLQAIAANPAVIFTPHIGWYSMRSANVLRRSTIERGIEAYSKPDVAMGLPV